MRSVFLRPRWIVLSVLVGVIVATFVGLGFWQLSRLDERRLTNAVLASRLGRPPISLDDLVSAGLPVEDLEYTIVEVTGRFDGSGAVMVRNQTNDGEAGSHVVVPLALDDPPPSIEGVLVNVGWIPIDGNALPPEDPVVVVGYVRGSQTRPSFGRTEPDGLLTVVNRIDVPRLQAQVALELAPFWIQLASPDDPSAPPVPVDLPVLDEGTHFAYAMQWFAFAAISVIGFGALLRREAARGGGATRSYVVEDEPTEEPVP